ncbi:MAG: formyltetrahydrofolate deformylase [Anaerolineae bacterium]|nr:formyltetrahydrofolate deformylase [Anaerolineae bacterium]MDW8171521.1 formyltetrahydrofolate deformylase [Anaerolineae bacterium]
MSSAILLISCPDRAGLVATITDFIFRHNGNILHLDQHVDAEQDIFFMRVAWDLTHFALGRHVIAEAFAPIAQRFQMDWQLRFDDERQKMVIFVGKESHALYDILARWQARELPVDIPAILSNHPELGGVAEQFGLPFRVFPMHKETKAQAEREQLAYLETIRPDFIVLAKYMQILTADFVRHYPYRIINIHHSFLPAFVGAKPYHQAAARGVKIIGATSHYVTADLDAGPIIEQDVVRVTHKDSVADLVRRGKDLEKTVLSRAIYYHVQHRILVYNNKTVVFA